MKANPCENSLTGEMNWTIATETRFYVSACRRRPRMPRYACSTRQSGRFISGTPSGWLIPCANRRRPVSTRANLEI